MRASSDLASSKRSLEAGFTVKVKVKAVALRKQQKQEDRRKLGKRQSHKRAKRRAKARREGHAGPTALGKGCLNVWILADTHRPFIEGQLISE